MAGNSRDKIARRKTATDLPDANNVLVSGQSARYSGIYALEHNSSAVGIEDGEVFIRKGTTLPFCQDCGHPVKFKLLKKMQYIAEDPDFR